MTDKRIGRWAWVAWLGVTAILTGTAPAFAQQASGIAGVVKDTSGLAMPGVTVGSALSVLVQLVHERAVSDLPQTSRFCR